ncbi:hypothetical protein [Sphingomonas aerolata]
MTRDVLVERRAEPLAARARLVDRLKGRLRERGLPGKGGGGGTHMP